MVQITSQQLPANPKTDGMNWKVLITGIIIGVVVVLIAVVGTVLYKNAVKEEPVQKVSTSTQKTATPSAKTATPSATKDETADWKIYSNKSLGFSIKHPPKATFDEGTKRVDLFYEASSSPNFAYRWSFGISVESTLRKNLDDVKEAYLGLQGKYENFKKITIDGTETLKFKFTREGAVKPNKIFVVALKDGKEYQISLTLHDENLDLENFTKTFDSALSTFEFLE